MIEIIVLIAAVLKIIVLLKQLLKQPKKGE